MHGLDGQDVAGGPDRVAQTDARAIGIELGRIELQVMCYGASLSGKGLVGLDHVDVGHGQSGFLQRQAAGRHRADAHVFGLDAGVGVRHQTRQRLDAACLGGARFHQHHGRGRIVDARSIACGNGAVFLHEHRLHFLEIFDLGARAEVLILLEHHVALAALDRHGHDLVLEAVLGPGPFDAVVAFHGQLVLVFAADIPLGCHVFGGDAHVRAFKRIGQRAHHHVHHLAVAHACAPAGGEAGIRAAAHVLCAAANGHVAITEQNGLCG